MKTTVEINGYFIDVEEKDGVISVTATFEDEVIEEFSIEVEEGQGEGQEEQDEEEVQGFDEFGQDEEEEDFEDDEEEDEKEDEKVEGQLESFQSFINKKK